MDGVAKGPSALEVSPGSERTTRCIKTASTGKKRRVVVIGNSHLKGTEGPICRADPALREVCCLPGARVKDIARKLPSLVRSTDYYPLLLFHVGGDETEAQSPQSIKRDCRTLGQVVRGSGAQCQVTHLIKMGALPTFGLCGECASTTVEGKTFPDAEGLEGGATKDMGKMLGGDEEKDPDAAKKEEERQEALRQEEEERKAKYAKMEAEREVMRQGIRDKVGIRLSAHT
ncbi:PREDICTED: uncharacterized protein LOC104383543, partial [Tauraco erythrolophus]